MKRSVHARMVFESSGATEVILAIAPTADAGLSESLSIRRGGEELPVTELAEKYRTRLHLAESSGGRVELEYRAEFTGRTTPLEPEEVDAIHFRRPSRYCESDTLLAVARAEFAGLQGLALLDAVGDWVNGHLAYVSGSSVGTDGAVQTLLARRGVCRDYAHLSIALLRALDVPARMVSVYAPGLSPMDFHAVTEALIDGQWLLLDTTRLAPRESMLRIATGRDAADTAFLTTHGADITLHEVEVLAVVDELPTEDPRLAVALR